MVEHPGRMIPLTYMGFYAAVLAVNIDNRTTQSAPFLLRIVSKNILYKDNQNNRS